MQTAANRPYYRSRWWMPAFAVFLGLLMLAAFAIGDNLGDGLMSFGVMVAVALGIVVFRRNETVSGLSGPGRDERWERIDIHATALTGMVLIAVIIGAFLVEVARGEDGQPWSLLGAVGGVTYIAAVLLLRARS
jgi:drug/metabolite transporter (DMT)-like permease